MKLLRAKAVLPLIALAIGLLATTAAPTASAVEERESIMLSPVSKAYDRSAGDIFRDVLTVTNDGTVAYDFLMYGRPYSVQNSAYNPNFTDVPSNADAYKWVQFDKTSYHLEAGQSATIEYTVRVPAGASPGGHYGVLFAETQPAEGAASNSVVRKKRVGTILYATIKGQYTMGGEIIGASVPFLQNRPPLSATTSVKNTGNADFIDTVTYMISDIFGNPKYQAQKSYPVLPQTTRDITLEWSEAPWFGLYKVHVAHQYLDKKSSHDALALVIPRWLMIIAVIAFVGGVLYAGIRYRKKRA